MSDEVLIVLKAVAVVIAFVGCAIGLLGFCWVSLRYYYLKNNAKNVFLAFFAGPLVLMVGDKDEKRYVHFIKYARVFGLLLVLSGMVLVALT